MKSGGQLYHEVSSHISHVRISLLFNKARAHEQRTRYLHVINFLEGTGA